MRQDYEYLRARTRNLFLNCEPRAVWRHVAVTQRRTTGDFAHQMQWLVDAAYPDVPAVRLVLDDLNTHRMASLYETFPAAEDMRIAKRLEFHHTPKHGSWLNIAEIDSAYCPEPVPRDAIRTRTHSSGTSALTRHSAMRPQPPSTGVSPPRMQGPRCVVSTSALSQFSLDYPLTGAVTPWRTWAGACLRLRRLGRARSPVERHGESWPAAPAGDAGAHIALRRQPRTPGRSAAWSR